MSVELILKLLLSVFLSVSILINKKTDCSSNCFISSILIGITSTVSTILFSTSSNTGYLIFFAIIIGVFIIKNNVFIPTETLIIILIGFNIGIENYIYSFIITLFVIIISLLISYLYKVNKIDFLSVFVIEIEDKASTMIDIKKILMDIGIKITKIKLTKSQDGFSIELYLKSSETKIRKFIEKTMELKGVIELNSENFNG